jgi:polysaccharide pyruvyl transferase WcaK-like protein
MHRFCGLASHYQQENAMSHILLRSSWQSVNIGDIGHTPGLLEILKRNVSDAKITLWPCHMDCNVESILKAAFPRLLIVRGQIGPGGRPDTPELQRVFEEADFFLHGSGPSVVMAPDLAVWHLLTGKPYGIYGVTIEDINDELKEILSGADFIFCRDTHSLRNIRQAGISCPCMDFGPDATFAFTLLNEKKAEKFLAEHDLKDKEFICAIPRLRYSPYYKIHQTVPTPEDLRREAVSDRFKDRDMSKLREALIAFVRKTSLKVLTCPEMIYEMALAKEELIDPMPDDVKPYVVWREQYWNPDEAASVYVRSLALVSMELHSPIMAVAQGIPSIYLRVPTDTIKGQMWRDIGLPEWILEMEESASEDIYNTLISIQQNYPVACKKVVDSMTYVQKLQAQTSAVLVESLERCGS